MTKLATLTLTGLIIALISFTELGWTGVPGQKVLYAFQAGTDGNGPQGSLMFDVSGNLYGTTVAGGTGNAGTVFELIRTSGGWSEAVLYSFQGGTDGNYPTAGLVMDGAGNLYGTTFYGGNGVGCVPVGCGTVFELTPPVNGGSWTESILYSFQGGDDGAHPNSGVILDKLGNLYGTASDGGNFAACPNVGCGTVFELSSASGSWKKATLYIFQGGTQDGESPAGLTMDSTGNLYGTTFNGGIDNVGLVYEVYSSNGNWSEKVLHVFTGDCARGCNPVSTLVFNSKGDLFGTANGRNSSFCCGIVFALGPGSGGWNEQVVFRFNSSRDGTASDATPVLDAHGNFYDTGSSGEHHEGIAYRLHPTKGGVTEAFYSFCSQSGCTDGSTPSGGLILDGSGNLYGTTLGGGLGYGVVYEITP